MLDKETPAKLPGKIVKVIKNTTDIITNPFFIIEN